MSSSETGQVTASAAEVYDEFFVPALFAEWASRLCDAALIGEGQSVLDVACGSGVAALEASTRVGALGSVTGVDINEGMLAVAGRHDADVEWRQAGAEALPFDDDSFDAVISQFGLMFFADPDQAVREMARVARPGGRLAVAVWADLTQVPGYAAMVELLHRLFGPAAADALRAPYSMGDAAALEARFGRAGLVAQVATVSGTARFPSLESWLHTEIRGWTLADSIDDEQYQRLCDAAPDALAQFVQPDGSVAFEHPALIATAVAS